MESDSRINEALEELRAAIKPVVKDKAKRAEATAGWLAVRLDQGVPRARCLRWSTTL